MKALEVAQTIDSMRFDACDFLASFSAETNSDQAFSALRGQVSSAIVGAQEQDGVWLEENALVEEDPSEDQISQEQLTALQHLAKRRLVLLQLGQAILTGNNTVESLAAFIAVEDRASILNHDIFTSANIDNMESLNYVFSDAVFGDVLEDSEDSAYQIQVSYLKDIAKRLHAILSLEKRLFSESVATLEEFINHNPQHDLPDSIFFNLQYCAKLQEEDLFRLQKLAKVIKAIKSVEGDDYQDILTALAGADGYDTFITLPPIRDLNQIGQRDQATIEPFLPDLKEEAAHQIAVKRACQAIDSNLDIGAVLSIIEQVAQNEGDINTALDEVNYVTPFMEAVNSNQDEPLITITDQDLPGAVLKNRDLLMFRQLAQEKIQLGFEGARSNFQQQIDGILPTDDKLFELANLGQATDIDEFSSRVPADIDCSDDDLKYFNTNLKEITQLAAGAAFSALEIRLEKCV